LGDFLSDTIKGHRRVAVVDAEEIISETSRNLLVILSSFETLTVVALTLEASDEGVIRWWVDASFAVHLNMRSHTGAVLSLGEWSGVQVSTKQKINTKRSCEAELVGVDDALPVVLWTLQFLKAR
jgi:hypothetical protein